MSNRNLIICSDGTGNTFDKSISNVTRLIRLLGLHNNESQIVMYDQEIGTNAKRLRDVRDHANSIPDRKALVVLDGPRDWWFSPSGLTVRVLGLLAGFGLKDNVREMYYQLSQLYEGRNDNVFLFGFSRGVFTVRALAGLIYRCGLPRRDVTDFKACFEEAWYLYQPHVEPEAAVKDFRTRYGQRDCKIHFLGIWDTVKSYGGLRPISLPHLRHNPIVGTVRHALGLDERRSWFNATTWGQLDLDENGAKTRLKKEDLPKYLSQDIEAVLAAFIVFLVHTPVVIAADGAEARAQFNAAKCETLPSTDSRTALLRVAPEAICTFSIDQAKQGIEIPFDIEVSPEITRLRAAPLDIGQCQAPDANGLIVFPVVSLGEEVIYCPGCDVGYCPSAVSRKDRSPQAGKHRYVFRWRGERGFGPSHFPPSIAPIEPIEPGDYGLNVTAGFRQNKIDAMPLRLKTAITIRVIAPSSSHPEAREANSNVRHGTGKH